MLQFRPQPGHARSNDPLYNPQRDVAYLGPRLIAMAIEYAFKSAETEEWFKQFLNHYGLSRQVLEPLGPAVLNLISSIHQDFGQALKTSGFSSLPVAAQVAFYTKMGQLLLASIHHGLRQITDINETHPKSVKKLAAKIDEIMQKYRLP